MSRTYVWGILGTLLFLGVPVQAEVVMERGTVKDTANTFNDEVLSAEGRPETDAVTGIANYRDSLDASTSIAGYTVEHGITKRHPVYLEEDITRMTSANPIGDWPNSDSNTEYGCWTYSSVANLSSIPGMLHINTNLFHNAPNCGSNYTGAAYGLSKWVADDLVFTSTNGQTGSVEVQLPWRLCVEHGGGCTPDGPCTAGYAHSLGGNARIIDGGPTFFNFAYGSHTPIPGGPGGPVPTGVLTCEDFIGPVVSVELDRISSWGPDMVSHIITMSGLSGGEQTDSAFLEAILTFGGLPADASAGVQRTAVSSSVFIVPEGITVNAPSIGLVDNAFVEVQEIPTVSEWGMAVLVLLLLTGGTVVIGRARRISKEESRLA